MEPSSHQKRLSGANTALYGVPTNLGPPPTYSETLEAGSGQRHSYLDPLLAQNLSLRSSSSIATTDDDDRIIAQALQFTTHSPLHLNSTPLPLPIAIPQIASGFGMPFARGYAPTLLGTKAIRAVDFVAFIDSLNIVLSSSPPLQALETAGALVGFVPLGHAQAIAGGLQVVAKVGNAVLAKARGERFVREVNAVFFAPRGLRMAVVTGAVLRESLGMEVGAAAGWEISVEGRSSSERRMAELGGRVAGLTFDVPEPSERTDVLDRLCAAQQKRNLTKQEDKAKKQREKEVEKQSARQRGSEAEMAKVEGKYERKLAEKDHEVAKLNMKAESETGKKPKDAEKIERKREKDVRKVEEDFEEVQKMDKGHAKATGEMGRKGKEGKKKKKKKKESSEEKKVAKLSWIWVENL